MPLSLPLFTLLDKYVVRDGVPGIVNANKEEEQRSSAKDEQIWARMGVSPCMPIQPALHTPQMEAEHETTSPRTRAGRWFALSDAEIR
jgi:hypothetical protein